MQGNYSDIRQIINDAVEPIREQLDRIYESLITDFVRKDSIEPRIKALEDRLDIAKKEHEELEQHIMSTPQRYILYGSSIVGLILSLVSIFSHFSFK